ncbi:unnamed protein product [Paramecium octaurelia]|uniref:Uncharacterized protein n=1 Tax=Paramecium octaurelia TaxID=43137 RepID=A0A8S1XZ22_PAROT|nr:unnamed protein product [Paramecium octaurelia]
MLILLVGMTMGMDFKITYCLITLSTQISLVLFVRSLNYIQELKLNVYDFDKTEKYSFKHKLFQKNQKQKYKRQERELLPQIKEKLMIKLSINQSTIIYVDFEKSGVGVFVQISHSAKRQIIKRNAYQRQEFCKLNLQIFLSRIKNDLFDLLTNNITADTLFRILENSITKKISLN